MKVSKLERDFQAELIRDLKELFPGCVILKNDASYQQGIPDLVILFKTRWAMLEAKADRSSKKQPNQDYWVDMLDDMSYASFVHPENREQVIHELCRALRP